MALDTNTAAVNGVGTTGSDDLVGGAGNSYLRGSYDDDRLFGEAGNDRLVGDYNTTTGLTNDGNDLLDGGSGEDTLTGGGHRAEERGEAKEDGPRWAPDQWATVGARHHIAEGV